MPSGRDRSHRKAAVLIPNVCFLSKNLTEAIQNGVYPVGNESQIEDSNWDFSNSFFFAGTVVSTIGKSDALHVYVCNVWLSGPELIL